MCIQIFKTTPRWPDIFSDFLKVNTTTDCDALHRNCDLIENAISVGQRKVAQVYKATWDEMKMFKFNWEDLGNLVVSKYFMFSPLYNKYGASSHQQNLSFRNFETRIMNSTTGQLKWNTAPLLMPQMAMSQIWETSLSNSQMRIGVSKSHLHRAWKIC